MFQDPKFWLAVSFFIFFAFMLKVVLPKIILILKRRSDEISEKFNAIEKLRKKAQKTLDEARIIHDNMTKEAERIIENANNEAKKILKKAEEDLNNELKYKIKLAEDQIEKEKEKIIRNAKNSVISLAIDEIKKTFEKDKKINKNIEENSILHISKAIN